MSYSSTILADSPIVYWQLNETSGTTATDSSGHSNTGTYVGTYTHNVSAAGASLLSNGVTLDGSTGYINVPTITQINTGGLFSVEVWINGKNVGGSTNGRILATDHTDINAKGFQLVSGSSNNDIWFDIGVSGSPAVYSPSYLQLNNFWNNNGWNHLVATYNGSYISLYINAILVSQTAATGTIVTPGYNLNIGRNPAYTGDYYGGTISNVAIYNSALNSTQITNHYNAAGSNPNARVSQEIIEVIASNSLNNARISQIVVEAIVPINNDGQYENLNTIDSATRTGDIFYRNPQDSINNFIDYTNNQGNLIYIPPLQNLTLVSTDGAYSYADLQLNTYFAFYGNTNNSGIISYNYSLDQIDWQSNDSNAINQSNINDCVFNSAFNVFNNYFNLAWQESNPSGTLNIKFVDIPIVNQQLISNQNTLNPNQTITYSQNLAPLYVYPNISVSNNFKTQNIPFSNIEIIDESGSSFNLNTYNNANFGKGAFINTQYSPQSVSFIQEFRQPNSVINILLTTVATASQAKSPLSGYPINIYRGSVDKHLYQRIFTGVDGKVSITLQPGQYTFEYDLLETSIDFQQIIL
jgi:hypothetical protein